MPWIRTTDCQEPTPEGSYCLCPPFPGDILVPGADGETKSATCNPCGPFGVQISPELCCNFSGSAAE